MISNKIKGIVVEAGTRVYQEIAYATCNEVWLMNVILDDMIKNIIWDTQNNLNTSSWPRFIL